MAWVSPKVYDILSKSEEGKDILEGIADKDQAEVDKEVDAFFGKGGVGAKDAGAYAQAKMDDEEDEEYKEPSNYEELEEAIQSRRKNGRLSQEDAEKLTQSLFKLSNSGVLTNDQYEEIAGWLDRLQGEVSDAEMERIRKEQPKGEKKEDKMIKLYRLYDKASSKEEKNEYLKQLNKLIEGE